MMLTPFATLVLSLSSTSTLTFTLTPTSAVAPVIERVEIRGHRVLSEDVYRALAALSEHTPVGPDVADRAAGRIQQFLRLAGYELARVRAVAKDGRLLIEIDEGQLERVVFPGGGGLGSLRLQLTLDLPELVFNRPSLERQLDALRRDHGIVIDRYRLMPVRGSTTGVMQLSDLGSVKGLELSPTLGRYELQIFVAERDLPPGFALELQGTAADGLVGAFKYRFADLILSGDRLELGARGGFRAGKIFAGQEELRWVSRLGAYGSWFSPEIFRQPLRVVVRTETAWWNRSRLDIALTQYDFFSLEPTLALRLRLARFLEFWAGGGGLWDRLVAFETSDPSRTFDAPAGVQPLIFARAEMAFGDEASRLDQLHRVELSATQVLGSAHRTRLSGHYRKTIGLGWDELILQSGVAGVLGSPPFYALERAGDAIKGLSADRLYSRLVGSAGAEYRLSLVRERYKVGAFYDGALFRREHSADRARVGYAQAFGLGAHLLILDTFRLSLYVALGFADSSTLEQAFAMSFVQIF